MPSRSDSIGNLQRRAWGFYGYPGSSERAVGEVRYVVGWMGDQMTRLDWDIFINDSDAWTVTLTGDDDEQDTITTLVDGEQNQTEASTRLLNLIDWTDTNVRGVTTNLFVPGQGDYARLEDGWEIVSTIDPDRKKKLANRTTVPFLWPHPADPSKPDAPLFAVLELLDELDWLNRQARTQSKQRAMISGIAAVADGFEGPQGASFWDTWNATLSARMDNPDDLSPVRLSGPHELVKDGINWVVPPFDYDNVLDRRVLSAIHRLAYGLPVPPEILLGMQAQSRATAFQVEENAYRAHIEPPAMMVAQVAQDALTLLLEDVEVRIVPNPARLLARKNSVQDVKDAYDRGLVTPEYVREVLGIPEDAAPEEDGVAPGTVAVAPSDPANDAAGEASPITASEGGDDDLSSLLADIDTALASEIAGATVMATDRARQRLGAAARANSEIRSDRKYKGLSNAQLARRLGVEGLTAARVEVLDQVAEPIDAATQWWLGRISQAWLQVGALVPGWKGQGDWIDESILVLAESLARHIMDTLQFETPTPLDAGAIRVVLDTAAGGQVAA